jgi:preprotein translocase subunit SecF
MGMLRVRTVAIWVVVAWALAVSIYIGWRFDLELGGSGSCRCGDRPPL